MGGWMLTGLLTRATGAPLTILDGFDRTGLGGNNIRPNFAPGVNSVPVLGNPGEYFNPTVFALSPAGTFGDLGRDTLTGPALVDLDTALIKNTPVKTNLGSVQRAVPRRSLQSGEPSKLGTAWK